VVDVFRVGEGRAGAREGADGREERGWFARDVYSLAHFPIIGGVIGIAAAVEDAVHHPGEHLTMPRRGGVGGRSGLFVGGVGLTLLRARRRMPVLRAVVVVALLALLPLLTAWPAAALTLVAIVAGVVAVFERAPLTAPSPS
jgi:low temperature requirement protein LtrA